MSLRIAHHPNTEATSEQSDHMRDPLRKRQIIKWLDETIVLNVEEINDPEPEYNLSIDISGYPLHIVRESDDDIIRILAQYSFDPGLLASIFDRGRYKRNFRTQMTSVIINTPGVYQFLDAEGNDASYENLKTVRFEHHIYEDGASRQRLMDSVMAIITAALYVSQISDNLAQEIKDTQ